MKTKAKAATLPAGFFELTGINSLRPIYVRATDVMAVNMNWRAARPKAPIEEMQEHIMRPPVLAPPEDDEWATVIHMSFGCEFNVIEEMETVLARMREAMGDD